jgi:hypothetical protein
MGGEQFSEAFALLVDLALKRGQRNIQDAPGLAVIEIDGAWTARVNGHREEVDGVPPLHAVIEWRGTPVGVMSPMAGVLALGAEDELIAALRAQGAALEPGHG